MENVIRKLYGMYMDNDNREKNEMSVMHDDLCKEKKEKAYQCYQKLRVQLTDELAEELDELMNKHMEIYPQELEESFAMGFKTGASIRTGIIRKKLIKRICGINSSRPRPPRKSVSCWTRHGSLFTP